MLKLKDRQKQVPNGFSFYLPEVKWSAPRNFPSFTVVCNGLEAVVRANPYLAAQHKWPTDRKGIEDWVDFYNASVCARMGWDDYIVTDAMGGSAPKAQPPHQQATLQSLRNAVEGIKSLVSGAKTLIGWLDSGEPAVSSELSLKRAIVCSACPHNKEGDFSNWFTTSASELIKRQVEKAQARKLTTPRDEMLHLCEICHCPLRLKCQTPFKWIAKEMRPEILVRLKAVPGCWVATESDPSQSVGSATTPK